MEPELSELVQNDVENRRQWADRLATWYMMRHDGIPRMNKPWPWASDLHYPLADTVIEKLKPFYLNQMFATDRFCDFVSKDPLRAEEAVDAAYWFDYKVKQCSNLEAQVLIAIDYMLTYGHGVLKVTWDMEAERLCYYPIMPLFLVVPQDCDEICYCERVTHVRHMTPWQYKNGPESGKFNQDASLLKRITGTKETNREGQYSTIKRISEGITHAKDPDTIILWEIYERESDGNYQIHTICPQLPEENIRAPYRLPYKNGEYDKPELPFIDFTMVKEDTSYYSGRGVCEIVSQFESSMNRMWNEKHDCMTLYNRPMLTADKDFPNVTNIKCRPGQILPFSVRPIQMGSPPISFDVEMENCRIVAEQRIAVPDFSLGSRSVTQDKKNPTATEVNALMGTVGQVVDMRARIFRLQINALYRQSWGLLKQYDDDMKYLRDSTYKELPEDIRDEIISIRPNGSSDSWNLHLRSQRAIQRKTLLGQSPFINQGELDKSILELDEPGLVARLYQDPNEKQQIQAERQMTELSVMNDGFPMSINDDDDDQVHAQITMQYLLRQAQTGKQPEDPAGPQMILQHLQAHMQRGMQVNSKLFGQLQRNFQQQIAQMGQSQQAPQGPNGNAPPQPQPAMQ